MVVAVQTLDTLAPGQKAVVKDLTCEGLERRRLMDLGILPGTVIEPELKSPLGDPTAYLVRGTLIALRREQARHIHVVPLEEEQDEH